MNANFLATSIFIAFIVFITIRGELGAYLSLVGIEAGDIPSLGNWTIR